MDNTCFDLKASGIEVKQVALRSKQVFQVKLKKWIRKSVVVDLNARKLSNSYHVIVSVQSQLTFVVGTLLLAVCFDASYLVIEKQFLHSLFDVLLVSWT